MDWKDINTYGALASLLGIVISFIAFIAADNAKKAARKVRDSFLFDKRIPQHLKALDELLSKYNDLLNDINENQSEIRTLHAQVKSELVNLGEKVKTEKAIKLIDSTISKIEKKTNRDYFKETESQRIHLKIIDFIKRFYLTSHKDLYAIYTDLNEIHFYVNNLKLDRKYLIK